MAFLRSTYRRLKFGDPIVVVSGLPRSGTSMCMKMMEAGGLKVIQDGIRTADEDNPKGYYEFEKVKDLDKGGDKSWLRDHRGKVVKIISFLLPELPEDNDYKVLFMIRNIQEVLASQQKMLDHRGEEDDLTDEQMSDLYAGHLAQVKRLMKMSPNFEFIDIKYKAALSDPRTAARQIDDFLGMKLDVDAMAGVVDDKLYRNRR